MYVYVCYIQAVEKLDIELRKEVVSVVKEFKY